MGLLGNYKSTLLHEHEKAILLLHGNNNNSLNMGFLDSNATLYLLRKIIHYYGNEYFRTIFFHTLIRIHKSIDLVVRLNIPSSWNILSIKKYIYTDIYTHIDTLHVFPSETKCINELYP